MLVGRIGELDQGTAAAGNPSPGEPFGEFRFWNLDAFAQDSWKLRSNLTARIRRALRPAGPTTRS